MSIQEVIEVVRTLAKADDVAIQDILKKEDFIVEADVDKVHIGIAIVVLRKAVERCEVVLDVATVVTDGIGDKAPCKVCKKDYVI